MTLRFLSLSSGSCGNCYWLGTERYSILIDAGIPVRTIQKVLKDNDLPFERVMGLLITHDHTDHIRSAGSLGDLYHLPVYAPLPVHEGMNRNYGMQKKLSVPSRRVIERDVPFLVGGTDFHVTAFTVPHDSTDCVGYFIEAGDPAAGPTVTFCLVTDCGKVTPEIIRYLSRADHIVVESNHDVDMLMNGSYPQRLKRRVRGEGGHTSNAECATLLHDVWHPSLRHVFLCHLSEENNDPDLCYRTASKALQSEGVRVGEDITLAVLMRNSPSLLYSLGTFGLPDDTQLRLEFGD